MKCEYLTNHKIVKDNYQIAPHHLFLFLFFVCTGVIFFDLVRFIYLLMGGEGAWIEDERHKYREGERDGADCDKTLYSHGLV